MSPHDPLKELLHTIKVATLFFAIAAIAFSLHSVCDYLEKQHFSTLYVLPLKILEFAAFLSDALYLGHHLLDKIVDSIFAIIGIYNKIIRKWGDFKRENNIDNDGDSVA